MALNTRSLFDPRWVFANRQSVQGSMLIRGEVFRIDAKTPDTSTWEPFAANPANRQPLAPVNETLIYLGPARVQPNQDWRARKVNWGTETVTEHAVRVALSFEQNELATSGEQFPIIQPRDFFRVLEVLTVDGIKVDPNMLGNIYTIRVVNSSSNAWTRDMLCDIVTDQVGAPLA